MFDRQFFVADLPRHVRAMDSPGVEITLKGERSYRVHSLGPVREGHVALDIYPSHGRTLELRESRKATVDDFDPMSTTDRIVVPYEEIVRVTFVYVAKDPKAMPYVESEGMAL